MVFFRSKAGQKAGFRVMLKYFEIKKAFRYYYNIYFLLLLLLLLFFKYRCLQYLDYLQCGTYILQYNTITYETNNTNAYMITRVAYNN